MFEFFKNTNSCKGLRSVERRNHLAAPDVAGGNPATSSAALEVNQAFSVYSARRTV
jgi:hypothetical protein